MPFGYLFESPSDCFVSRVGHLIVAACADDVACYQPLQLINNQIARKVYVVPSRSYAALRVGEVGKQLEQS